MGISKIATEGSAAFSGKVLNELGRPLTAAQQEKLQTFVDSKAGQRILAEQALISMEENLHLHSLQDGATVSASYQNFCRAQGLNPDAAGRTADSYEQKAILALHDWRSGITWPAGPYTHDSPARRRIRKWAVPNLVSEILTT